MKLVRSEVMRGIWPSYPKIQPYIRNQTWPFQLSADSRRPSHTPSSSTDSLLPSLLPHSFTASFNFQMECSDGIGGMGPLRTAVFHFPEMHLCRHPILVTVRSHASPHRSAHAVTLQRRSDGEMDGRRFLYRACFIKLMPNVVFASAFHWKAGFKRSFDTWKFLLTAGVISTSNTIIHNSLCWLIKCLRKRRRDIFWKKAEKDRGLSTLLLSQPGPPPIPPRLARPHVPSRRLAVLTWCYSSWICPCWMWRGAAPSCWGGAGVSWRGDGQGWLCWQAGVCSCMPELQYGRRCGCSSLTWRPSTPGMLLPRAAWPGMNPGEKYKQHTKSVGFLYV